MTTVLDQIKEYRRNWLHCTTRKYRNRLKHYRPKGRRNQRTAIKILGDVWDWNWSTVGPAARSYVMMMMMMMVMTSTTTQ
jgi:hypothetical protein